MSNIQADMKLQISTESVPVCANGGGNQGGADASPKFCVRKTFVELTESEEANTPVLRRVHSEPTLLASEPAAVSTRKVSADAAEAGKTQTSEPPMATGLKLTSITPQVWQPTDTLYDTEEVEGCRASAIGNELSSPGPLVSHGYGYGCQNLAGSTMGLAPQGFQPNYNAGQVQEVAQLTQQAAALQAQYQEAEAAAEMARQASELWAQYRDAEEAAERSRQAAQLWAQVREAEEAQKQVRQAQEAAQLIRQAAQLDKQAKEAEEAARLVRQAAQFEAQARQAEEAARLARKVQAQEAEKATKLGRKGKRMANSKVLSSPDTTPKGEQVRRHVTFIEVH